MNIFFTADCHFSHDNIRKHCNRPWSNINDHDQGLIENWNKTVGRKDTTYILGDFAMIKKSNDGIPPMKKYRKIIHALNGKKILIIGNHDSMNQETYACFTKVYDGIRDMTIDRQKITLCHYPMRSWNCSFHGAWHFFGHVHGRTPEQDGMLSCDVGVDVPEWNYTPVSWDQLKAKFAIKKTKWLDYWNKNDKSWKV